MFQAVVVFVIFSVSPTPKLQNLKPKSKKLFDISIRPTAIQMNGYSNDF